MVGDHIRVRRKFHKIPLYYHHGIEVENDKVIHYGEGRLFSKKNTGVVETSMDDFLKGGKKEVVSEKGASRPDVVVKRARSQLGEKGYHMIFNNCEHFAHWCKTGDKKSPQVRAGTALAVAGAVATTAGILLKKKMMEKQDIVERIEVFLQ